MIGILRLNETSNSSHITDGMTNTFMVVERAGLPYSYENGSSVGTYVPATAWAGYKAPFPINELNCGLNKIINCKNRQEIYSFHPGGSVFLFGGGGVTFESEDMNPLIFIAKFTRDGAELVFRE